MSLPGLASVDITGTLTVNGLAGATTLALAGVSFAAAATGNGSNAGSLINATGGTGQPTTTTTAGQAGGQGGSIIINGGVGGAVTGATGATNGGVGGALFIVAGVGGANASSTGVGGGGGGGGINAGVGGSATHATGTTTSGSGGTASVNAGAGGSNASTAGTGGLGGQAQNNAGTGGNATAATGVTFGGAGGAAIMHGGDGGFATSTAGTNGSGGHAYIFGGAAGNGAGIAGATGLVIIAHTGTAARGRVGIGTNAPSSSYMLDVTGRINATSGYNGILLSDLPAILSQTLLNYDSTGSNIENGTTYPTSPVTTGGWQTCGPSQSFTSNDPSYIYEITLSGFGFFIPGSTAEFGSSILMDGSTFLTFGGDAGVGGVGANIFSGAASFFVTGLTNGSHSLQAKFFSSQGGSLYVRGTQEWMRITVREYRR